MLNFFVGSYRQRLVAAGTMAVTFIAIDVAAAHVFAGVEEHQLAIWIFVLGFPISALLGRVVAGRLFRDTDSQAAETHAKSSGSVSKQTPLSGKLVVVAILAIIGAGIVGSFIAPPAYRNYFLAILVLLPFAMIAIARLQGRAGDRRP
jgi:archaellum biogenesis protein FlaJ (TadC family)